MSSANIAFVDKKGSIKSVTVERHGEIDELGIELAEYFLDLSDVKELVVTSIIQIEDGEVSFENIEYPDEYEIKEYDNKDEFMDDLESDTYYYLFENDEWFVKKVGHDEFRELEVVLEQEY